MAETVVVTGAAGFIGSEVCRLLTSHGYAVRAVSREPSRVRGFDKPCALPAIYDMPGWRRLLDGVVHVVHCAGISHGEGRAREAYEQANTRLTATLAAAAAPTISGKVVFLSSIRAISGPVNDHIVTDAAEPRPQDHYGRSKLAAEQRLREAFGGSGRFTILRPVAVYGKGMRGSLAALARLAALPTPLPFKAVDAPRSLLDLASCAAAVEHALTSPATDGRAFLVCDRRPIGTAEILAAFRRAHGRFPNMFTVPRPLLAFAFATLGQGQTWRRLSGPLVADPSELAATGWKPVEDTAQRLEALARLQKASGLISI